MKATIDRNAAPHPLTYPVLMETTGASRVVLFLDRNTGVALDADRARVEAFIPADDAEVWRRFNGTVSMSNS